MIPVRLGRYVPDIKDDAVFAVQPLRGNHAASLAQAQQSTVFHDPLIRWNLPPSRQSPAVKERRHAWRQRHHGCRRGLGGRRRRLADCARD